MLTAPVLWAALLHVALGTTFQDLMNPEIFPKPQAGMKVLSVIEDAGFHRVTTTGMEMSFDPSRGWILFEQRIGRKRPIAFLAVGGPISGPKLTHYGPGFVRIEIQQPPMVIRVNGDSLCMVQARQPVKIAIHRQLEAVWSSSFGVDHLLADELGAFGIYCSNTDQYDHFDPYGETVAAYDLPADGVMWLAICPPKPYNWERSIKDQVVWHWSNELAYPPNDVLKALKPQGNIALLQSEVMLWRDWNLDFVPRLGTEEFARTRDSLHQLGMKLIVYTSPAYFLKGTPLESQAFNSFEGFKGWPVGTTTGENMDLFLDAIGKLLKEHQPDGLYFDGQYTTNPAALYALARRSRELLGEDKILEWHSTWALGPNECYLPQADAYVDFILRGEGQESRHQDSDYLRFFVSGYNISNSIGVLCTNGPVHLTEEFLLKLLKANVRLHTLASWLGQKEIMSPLETIYRPRCTANLKGMVDHEMALRQSQVPQRVQEAQQERNALGAAPDWKDPVFQEEFSQMPTTESKVSPVNETPIEVVDGNLRITARSHTYAYLTIPLQVTARGLLIKLKQGTDQGMSWGPGAMLIWPGGEKLRIGTRSDGLIQSDILGAQVIEKEHDPAQWVWVRARWLGRSGVVERSADGLQFTKVGDFQHAGAFLGQTAMLLVGKVPFDGEPKDHSDPGETGSCEIDFVKVF